MLRRELLDARKALRSVTDSTSGSRSKKHQGTLLFGPLLFLAKVVLSNTQWNLSFMSTHEQRV